MLKTFRSKKRSRSPLVRRRCFFCSEDTDPGSFKNALSFSRFLSPRGKIVARLRTGVCARHQRKLGRSVKIARINGLLPFRENNFS